MGFVGFYLKQKTGISPTDLLDDVPATHSNDDIHCKVKKNLNSTMLFSCLFSKITFTF